VLQYRFLDLLNICQRNGYIPEEWGAATAIPIQNKKFWEGNRENCENYQGISFSSATYKLYAKMISRRISISEVLLS
jgi:hypothetical protein